VPSYKNYYKYEQKHHIKLIDYSYKFLLNYISFQFVNFITLEKFITNKEQHNIKHNFYNNFIFIINNLYQTKTNHNDISLDNIAVIKEDNYYELELFDFGNGDANNPNFIKLFQQDTKKITDIAKMILIQEDYRRFLNYLTKNYPFLKKII